MEFAGLVFRVLVSTLGQLILQHRRQRSYFYLQATSSLG